MSRIRDIMAMSPVMPVIVIERIDDAVPLARAGGMVESAYWK